MADGTELRHEVEKAATSPDQPCAVTDQDGRLWSYQPIDARDIAHCIVCAVESEAALGEAFNSGALALFSWTEGARMLGEIRDEEPLEIRLPLRSVYDHDITKTKSLIGHQPQGDIGAMMASGQWFEVGESNFTWN